MIFYMASLPNDCFGVLRDIYSMYQRGQLKGQHLPRTKKGPSPKSPDLKGSQFKCLRGIEFSTVYRLLMEIKKKQISMKELCCESNSMKQLQRVQMGFVKKTNCSGWAEAQQRFPSFATAQQLEPFKNLSFAGNTLPESLLRFCQQALECEKRSPVQCDADNVFSISHGMVHALFWKQDVHRVNPDNLEEVFSSAGLKFPGFTLCVFDLPNRKNQDQWNQQVDSKFFTL